MAQDIPWKEAIERVLRDAGRSLHYSEIARRIVAAGMRKSLGATPAATVSANLTTSIHNQGERSPFLKVGRGEYMLRGAVPSSSTADNREEDEDESSSEEQYEVMTAFGMYWRRTYVSWTSNPRLLGMQQLGASAVDFSEQLGIYLLYDGREVVYVGRSTERPLGRRLYEHTVDRLATRWDRFSWFGVRPVSEEGKLSDLPSEYGSHKIVPALEAVLIEALEPRQNRRRGDDLAAVEYIQMQDPEITRKLLKESIDLLVDRR